MSVQDEIMAPTQNNPEITTINILVAESHPVFSCGLEACLATTPEMRVVCHVGAGADVLMSMKGRYFDVMLLDTHLSGLEGFSLLKGIRDQYPAMPVLLMAAAPDVGWLLRGIRAGASGVVSKSAPVEEVLMAIRRVHSGHPYITEPLAEKLVLFYQRNEKDPLDERLSPREFEVMQWLSRGLKLSDIARKLHLSHQTITTHRRHILEKTGLRTTAEIIRYGILNGLCDSRE